MKVNATVERDGRYWLVHVPDVGVTQARHLREVERMAADLVATMLDLAPGDVEVEYEVRLPDSVRAHLDSAERYREEASHANRAAADEARAAARELSEMGLPLRDVGQALGVSYQRAHQLVRA